MNNMKIAVLDDELFYRNDLKQKLDNFFTKAKIPAAVDCYETADELMPFVGDYQILYVDYKLDGGTGLDFAAEVRRRNTDIGIVFVSSYPEYVFETFKVKAYRFIRKPIDPEELAESMSSFLREPGVRKVISLNYILTGKQHTDSADVMYIESQKKHCLITFVNGEKREVTTGIGDTAEALAVHWSANTSRYCYVFFDHIESVENLNVTMKDGTVLTLSRKYKDDFYDKWISYLMHK